MVSANFLKHFHFGLMLFALAMTPISALTGLRDSVPYLVMISMLALVLSEFGAWQAARAEEAADDAETIARCVMEKLDEAGVIKK